MAGLDTLPSKRARGAEILRLLSQHPGTH